MGVKAFRISWCNVVWSGANQSMDSDRDVDDDVSGIDFDDVMAGQGTTESNDLNRL